MTLIIK